MPRVTTKIANSKCPICGRETLYNELDPNSKPKSCGSCGAVYDDITFLSDQNPDASPSTHNMVRWGCRACKHYGVSWIKRGKVQLDACPNCGEPRAKGRMRFQRFDPSGSCDTIWKPVPGRTRTPIRTKLPKKVYNCPECGHKHLYLIRPMQTCPRCEATTEAHHA